MDYYNLNITARFHIQAHHRFGVGRAQVKRQSAKVMLMPSVRSTASASRLKCCSTRLIASTGCASFLLISPLAGNAAIRSRTSSPSVFPFQAHQFGDQQPRDHAAVTVSEIAEVMVSAHFATVDGVFLRIRSLIKACPVFDITGVPPAAVTTSMVFQERRGSWMIFAPGFFFRGTLLPAGRQCSSPSINCPFRQTGNSGQNRHQRQCPYPRRV